MYMYYISGNTYEHREEIKKLKPLSDNFKKYWKYNYDFRTWELEVANAFHTNKFENKVREFCAKSSLKLEILCSPSKVSKSINDFDTIEAYFDYFHKENC